MPFAFRFFAKKPECGWHNHAPFVFLEEMVKHGGNVDQQLFRAVLFPRRKAAQLFRRILERPNLNGRFPRLTHGRPPSQRPTATRPNRLPFWPVVARFRLSLQPGLSVQSCALHSAQRKRTGATKPTDKTQVLTAQAPNFVARLLRYRRND